MEKWIFQEEREINAIGRTTTLFQVYTADGLYGHHATCEKLEDARLITAAPDLYDAVNTVLENVKARKGTSVEGRLSIIDIGLMKAAIVKAGCKWLP